MNNGFDLFNKLTFLKLIILLVGFSCFSQSNSKNEPTIQGKLLLDSIWEPVVYLSHIPTFNDMNTMSNEMIIAETKVDSSGFFLFSSGNLPENDNLFRLHISKKGAPAASLIIGGKEENHIFFIANNMSQIYIKNKDTAKLFKEYIIEGHSPNQSLRKIDQIVSFNDSTDYELSSIKKEFVIKANHEKLRHVADTSSHPIVSLYALHHSKFESTFLTNQKFYKIYLKKWEGENSSYFRALRAKLPKEEGSKTIWFFLIGGSFFILGFILNYYFNTRRKRNRNQLKSLSVQERKIFQLMKSGKSNKEISEEYNIGLSTVKSHVSNIYSKLNINSRKEAMDFV